MPETLTGTCLCGGVEYEARDPQSLGYCHCTRCQHWTGSSLAGVVVAKENFKFTKGEDLAKTYESQLSVPKGWRSRLERSRICTEELMERPDAILFDVDGLLITTGGAGTRSWRWAFNELYGIPADIGKFTDAGMTDPVVGTLTFTRVVRHEPSPAELARVISHYLMRLPDEVAASSGYAVLAGVEELLPRLCKAGFLLGITTGAVEAAAHIKLARANLNRFFSFGGYGSDSDDRGELTRKAIERAGTIVGSTLDSQRVLVLGDTPNDIAAAHAAGAIGVGVASGHSSKDELLEAGADYVLGSLLEPLPGVADRLLKLDDEQVR
jgi:phosphoglycolate phosphatase-like HAD superfamily hydrolase